MRQYIVNQKETKEIDKIICNQCGKEIPVIKGVAREDYLSVEKQWGYFSKKDLQIHRFCICESCYDQLTESFAIPLEHDEKRVALD